MGEDVVVELTARVLIVEDHAVLADGLVSALRSEGFDAYAVNGPSAEAIVDAAASARPDLVVLDLIMGDGVGLTIPLVEPLRCLGAEVLILTGLTDRALWGAAIEAGACGVVTKTSSFDDVLERVGQALRHECAMPRLEREQLLAGLRARRHEERTRLAPFERLSPREQAVLAELMDGCSAEEIAEAAFVSTTTVRSQIHAVLTKLGARSQAAAIARAYRAGWRPQR
jgi:DNA-binding NarL/FixJ family response regulator